MQISNQTNAQHQVDGLGCCSGGLAGEVKEKAGMWTELWIVASFPVTLCRASMVSANPGMRIAPGWTCL